VILHYNRNADISAVGIQQIMLAFRTEAYSMLTDLSVAIFRQMPQTGENEREKYADGS
jgi:hypothetical protein